MPKERKIEAIESKADHLCGLGAVMEKGAIRFSVIVPQGEGASLLLYRKGEEKPEAEIPFPAKPVIGEIYSMKIAGFSWKEYQYNFKIGDVITQDVYGKKFSGREKFGIRDGNRELRCDFMFDEYDWEEDEFPCIPYEEAVMYHLHVRNYTMNRKSGVRHKGTFLGLQEKIPYLKELGINQVKLMPIYEFDELPVPKGIKPAHVPQNCTAGLRMNCWGYGEGYYFAPKRSYAFSKDAVKECKDMIKAFHANGIEVLLDFYFNEDISLRVAVDCLLYWVQEYHVDGFQIFGAEETGRLIAFDPALSRTKIITSYFPEKKQCVPRQFRNCAELNDGFLTDARRILKGDEGVMESFAYRCRRNSQQFGVINYLTNHDGFTLQDLVSYDTKHNEENGEQNEDGSAFNFSWNCGVEGETRKKSVLELRIRQMKNAILLMMLSQGVPMLLAGDEFGNSQKGNNNPYCLDNEVSWVSWNRYTNGHAFTEFVKKAIAFRKQHRIFHMDSELKMMDYRSCGYPDLSYHSSRAWYGGFEYNSRQIGMLYCDEDGKDKDFLYVAYNFHPLEQKLALPKLPDKMAWFKTIDTSAKESFLENEKVMPEEKRTCLIPARSIIVLRGREA